MLHVAVMQNNDKEMYNVQKSVLHVESCFC